MPDPGGQGGVQTVAVRSWAAVDAAPVGQAASRATDVEIVSDSLLLVQQMLGKYRVKHPNLVPLYERAKSITRHFLKFKIRHTLRAGNKDADRLANAALDRPQRTPNDRWIERHRVDS